MYYGWRKHIWFKIVALAVAGVFLLQDISWASRNDLRYSAKPSQPSHSEKTSIADFFKDIASMLVPSANAAEDDVLPTELDSQKCKTIPAANPNTYKKPVVSACAVSSSQASRQNENNPAETPVIAVTPTVVHAFTVQEPQKTAVVSVTKEVEAAEIPQQCDPVKANDTVEDREAPDASRKSDQNITKDITPEVAKSAAPEVKEESPSTFEPNNPQLCAEHQSLQLNNAVAPQTMLTEQSDTVVPAQVDVNTLTTVVKAVESNNQENSEVIADPQITVKKTNNDQPAGVVNVPKQTAVSAQSQTTEEAGCQGNDQVQQQAGDNITVSDILTKDDDKSREARKTQEVSGADLALGDEPMLPPLENVYIPRDTAVPAQAPTTQTTQQGQNNQTTQTAAVVNDKQVIGGDQSYTIIADSETVINDQWKVPASCGPPRQNTTPSSDTVTAVSSSVSTSTNQEAAVKNNTAQTTPKITGTTSDTQDKTVSSSDQVTLHGTAPPAQYKVNCAVISLSSFSNIDPAAIAKIFHEKGYIDAKGYTTLAQYQEVAKELNIDFKAVKATIADLDKLDQPAIAHLKNDHYVTITKVGDDSVTYMDNGVEKTVSKEEFASQWSGYLLTEQEGVGSEISSQEASQIKGAVWPWDAAAAWVNNNIIKPATNWVNNNIVQPIIRTASYVYNTARSYVSSAYNAARNYVVSRVQQYAAQVQKAVAAVQSVVSSVSVAISLTVQVSAQINNMIRNAVNGGFPGSLMMTQDLLKFLSGNSITLGNDCFFANPWTKENADGVILMTKADYNQLVKDCGGNETEARARLQYMAMMEGKDITIKDEFSNWDIAELLEVRGYDSISTYGDVKIKIKSEMSSDEMAAFSAAGINPLTMRVKYGQGKPGSTADVSSFCKSVGFANSGAKNYTRDNIPTIGAYVNENNGVVTSIDLRGIGYNDNSAVHVDITITQPGAVTPAMLKSLQAGDTQPIKNLQQNPGLMGSPVKINYEQQITRYPGAPALTWSIVNQMWLNALSIQRSYNAQTDPNKGNPNNPQIRAEAIAEFLKQQGFYGNENRWKTNDEGTIENIYSATTTKRIALDNGGFQYGIAVTYDQLGTYYKWSLDGNGQPKDFYKEYAQTGLTQYYLSETYGSEGLSFRQVNQLEGESASGDDTITVNGKNYKITKLVQASTFTPYDENFYRHESVVICDENGTPLTYAERDEFVGTCPIRETPQQGVKYHMEKGKITAIVPSGSGSSEPNSEVTDLLNKMWGVLEHVDTDTGTNYERLNYLSTDYVEGVFTLTNGFDLTKAQEGCPVATRILLDIRNGNVTAQFAVSPTNIAKTIVALKQEQENESFLYGSEPSDKPIIWHQLPEQLKSDWNTLSAEDKQCLISEFDTGYLRVAAEWDRVHAMMQLDTITIVDDEGKVIKTVDTRDESGSFLVRILGVIDPTAEFKVDSENGVDENGTLNSHFKQISLIFWQTAGSDDPAVTLARSLHNYAYSSQFAFKKNLKLAMTPADRSFYSGLDYNNRHRLTMLFEAGNLNLAHFGNIVAAYNYQGDTYLANTYTKDEYIQNLMDMADQQKAAGQMQLQHLAECNPQAIIGWFKLNEAALLKNVDKKAELNYILQHQNQGDIDPSLLQGLNDTNGLTLLDNPYAWENKSADYDETIFGDGFIWPIQMTSDGKWRILKVNGTGASMDELYTASFDMPNSVTPEKGDYIRSYKELGEISNMIQNTTADVAGWSTEINSDFYSALAPEDQLAIANILAGNYKQDYTDPVSKGFMEWIGGGDAAWDRWYPTITRPFYVSYVDPNTNEVKYVVVQVTTEFKIKDEAWDSGVLRWIYGFDRQQWESWRSTLPASTTMTLQTDKGPTATVSVPKAQLNWSYRPMTQRFVGTVTAIVVAAVAAAVFTGGASLSAIASVLSISASSLKIGVVLYLAWTTGAYIAMNYDKGLSVQGLANAILQDALSPWIDPKDPKYGSYNLRNKIVYSLGCLLNVAWNIFLWEGAGQLVNIGGKAVAGSGAVFNLSWSSLRGLMGKISSGVSKFSLEKLSWDGIKNGYAAVKEALKALYGKIDLWTVTPKAWKNVKEYIVEQGLKSGALKIPEVPAGLGGSGAMSTHAIEQLILQEFVKQTMKNIGFTQTMKALPSFLAAGIRTAGKDAIIALSNPVKLAAEGANVVRQIVYVNTITNYVFGTVYSLYAAGYAWFTGDTAHKDSFTLNGWVTASLADYFTSDPNDVDKLQWGNRPEDGFLLGVFRGIIDTTLGLLGVIPNFINDDGTGHNGKWSANRFFVGTDVLYDVTKNDQSNSPWLSTQLRQIKANNRGFIWYLQRDPQMWMFAFAVGIFRPFLAPIMKNIPIVGAISTKLAQYDRLLGIGTSSWSDSSSRLSKWAGKAMEGMLNLFNRVQGFYYEEGLQELMADVITSPLFKNSDYQILGETLQEMFDRTPTGSLNSMFQISYTNYFASLLDGFFNGNYNVLVSVNGGKPQWMSRTDIMSLDGDAKVEIRLKQSSSSKISYSDTITVSASTVQALHKVNQQLNFFSDNPAERRMRLMLAMRDIYVMNDSSYRVTAITGDTITSELVEILNNEQSLLELADMGRLVGAEMTMVGNEDAEDLEDFLGIKGVNGSAELEKAKEELKNDAIEMLYQNGLIQRYGEGLTLGGKEYVKGLVELNKKIRENRAYLLEMLKARNDMLDSLKDNGAMTTEEVEAHKKLSKQLEDNAKRGSIFSPMAGIMMLQVITSTSDYLRNLETARAQKQQRLDNINNVEADKNDTQDNPEELAREVKKLEAEIARFKAMEVVQACRAIDETMRLFVEDVLKHGEVSTEDLRSIARGDKHRMIRDFYRMGAIDSGYLNEDGKAFLLNLIQLNDGKMRTVSSDAIHYLVDSGIWKNVRDGETDDLKKYIVETEEGKVVVLVPAHYNEKQINELEESIQKEHSVKAEDIKIVEVGNKNDPHQLNRELVLTKNMFGVNGDIDGDYLLEQFQTAQGMLGIVLSMPTSDGNVSNLYGLSRAKNNSFLVSEYYLRRANVGVAEKIRATIGFNALVRATGVTLADMVTTVVVHEMGHVRGLNHCNNKNCGMAHTAGGRLFDVMRKSGTSSDGYRLCEDCRRQLGDYSARDGGQAEIDDVRGEELAKRGLAMSRIASFLMGDDNKDSWITRMLGASRKADGMPVGGAARDEQQVQATVNENTRTIAPATVSAASIDLVRDEVITGSRIDSDMSRTQSNILRQGDLPPPARMPLPTPLSMVFGIVMNSAAIEELKKALRKLLNKETTNTNKETRSQTNSSESSISRLIKAQAHTAAAVRTVKAVSAKAGTDLKAAARTIAAILMNNQDTIITAANIIVVSAWIASFFIRGPPVVEAIIWTLSIATCIPHPAQFALQQFSALTFEVESTDLILSLAGIAVSALVIPLPHLRLLIQVSRILPEVIALVSGLVTIGFLRKPIACGWSRVAALSAKTFKKLGAVVGGMMRVKRASSRGAELAAGYPQLLSRIAAINQLYKSEPLSHESISTVAGVMAYAAATASYISGRDLVDQALNLPWQVAEGFNGVATVSLSFINRSNKQGGVSWSRSRSKSSVSRMWSSSAKKTPVSLLPGRENAKRGYSWSSEKTVGSIPATALSQAGNFLATMKEKSSALRSKALSSIKGSPFISSIALQAEWLAASPSLKRAALFVLTVLATIKAAAADDLSAREMGMDNVEYSMDGSAWLIVGAVFLFTVAGVYVLAKYWAGNDSPRRSYVSSRASGNLGSSNYRTSRSNSSATLTLLVLALRIVGIPLRLVVNLVRFAVGTSSDRRSSGLSGGSNDREDDDFDCIDLTSDRDGGRPLTLRDIVPALMQLPTVAGKVVTVFKARALDFTQQSVPTVAGVVRSAALRIGELRGASLHTSGADLTRLAPQLLNSFNFSRQRRSTVLDRSSRDGGKTEEVVFAGKRIELEYKTIDPALHARFAAHDSVPNYEVNFKAIRRAAGDGLLAFAFEKVFPQEEVKAVKRISVSFANNSVVDVYYRVTFSLAGGREKSLFVGMPTYSEAKDMMELERKLKGRLWNYVFRAEALEEMQKVIPEYAVKPVGAFMEEYIVPVEGLLHEEPLGYPLTITEFIDGLDGVTRFKEATRAYAELTAEARRILAETMAPYIHLFIRSYDRESRTGLVVDDMSIINVLKTAQGVKIGDVTNPSGDKKILKRMSMEAFIRALQDFHALQRRPYLKAANPEIFEISEAFVRKTISDILRKHYHTENIADARDGGNDVNSWTRVKKLLRRVFGAVVGMFSRQRVVKAFNQISALITSAPVVSYAAILAAGIGAAVIGVPMLLYVPVLVGAASGLAVNVRRSLAGEATRFTFGVKVASIFEALAVDQLYSSQPRTQAVKTDRRLAAGLGIAGAVIAAVCLPGAWLAFGLVFGAAAGYFFPSILRVSENFFVGAAKSYEQRSRFAAQEDVRSQIETTAADYQQRYAQASTAAKTYYLLKGSWAKFSLQNPLIAGTVSFLAMRVTLALIGLYFADALLVALVPAQIAGISVLSLGWNALGDFFSYVGLPHTIAGLTRVFFVTMGLSFLKYIRYSKALYAINGNKAVSLVSALGLIVLAPAGFVAAVSDTDYGRLMTKASMEFWTSFIGMWIIGAQIGVILQLAGGIGSIEQLGVAGDLVQLTAGVFEQQATSWGSQAVTQTVAAADMPVVSAATAQTQANAQALMQDSDTLDQPVVKDQVVDGQGHVTKVVYADDSYVVYDYVSNLHADVYKYNAQDQLVDKAEADFIQVYIVSQAYWNADHTEIIYPREYWATRIEWTEKTETFSYSEDVYSGAFVDYATYTKHIYQTDASGKDMLIAEETYDQHSNPNQLVESKIYDTFTGDVAWTVEYPGQAALQQVVDIDAIPSQVRQAWQQAGIDSDTMLQPAKITDASGATWMEYRIADAPAAHKIFEDRQGYNIFSTAWDANSGEPVFSYKATEDNQVMATLEAQAPVKGSDLQAMMDKQTGLIWTKTTAELLKEQLGIDIDAALAQMGVQDATEISVVKETPFQKESDSEGVVTYSDQKAMPTTHYKLPNDPQGRDVITIYPDKNMVISSWYEARAGPAGVLPKAVTINGDGTIGEVKVYTGEENVNGVPCHVYSVSNAATKTAEYRTSEGVLYRVDYDRIVLSLANIKDVTAGKEIVYYDLNKPYEAPAYATDENGAVIKQWQKTTYDNQSGVETQIVREEDPLVSGKWNLYEYKHDLRSGELLARNQLDMFKDLFYQAGPLPVWAWLVLGTAGFFLGLPAVLKKIFMRLPSVRRAPAQPRNTSASMPTQNDVEAAAAGYGFDREQVKAAALLIPNIFEGSSRSADEILAAQFESFKDWLDANDLHSWLEEQGIELTYGLDEMVLFRLVYLSSTHMRSITPGWRYYLYVKALFMRSQGVADVGSAIVGEADVWYLRMKEFYTGKKFAGEVKEMRMTYEDVEDIFNGRGEKDFVRDLLESGDYTTVLDAWAADPKVHKTYRDQFGWKGVLALGKTCWIFFAGMGASFAALVALAAAPAAAPVLLVAMTVAAGLLIGYALYQPGRAFKRILENNPGINGEAASRLKKLMIRQNISAISFWTLVFGSKLAVNFAFFTWVMSMSTAVSGFGLAAFWATLWVSGLWLPFVLFFVLDIFTFYYIWQYVFSLAKGYSLGLGRITSWKQLRSAAPAALEAYMQVLGLEGKMREDVSAALLSALAEELQEKGLLGDTEAARLAAGDFTVAPQNKQAGKRIVYFFNTLMMDLPYSGNWDDVPSLSVAITAAAEKVKAHLNADPSKTAEELAEQTDVLNEVQKGVGLTKLTHLIRQSPDEWARFIDSLAAAYAGVISAEQVRAWKSLRGEEAFEFNVDTGIDQAVRDAVVAAVEDWANLRFQALYRTIHGLANIWSAYEFLVKNVYFPDRRDDEAFVRSQVARKLQLVLAYQNYGKMDKKDLRRRDIDQLQKTLGCFDVVYLDEKENVLRTVKGAYTAPAKHGIHAQYKPMNQNNFMTWLTNDKILFFDANCDMRFEDALKLPNLLQEFNLDPLLKGINMPEYIFTEDFNWIGQVHGFGDRTWTTFVQRFLAMYGADGFYGHGAVFDREVIQEFGVLSPDYVSEDLMMAMKVWLKGKGYRIEHKEYIQAGKAREVSVPASSIPFNKFAEGAAELLLGRQFKRMLQSKEVAWYQKMNLFFTLGFYLRKPLVVFTMFSYISLVMVLGVSGFAGFPLLMTFGLLGILFSQVISFTGLGQMMLEKGIVRGALSFCRLFPRLLLVFPYYVLVYANGVINGFNGKAAFIVTKKSWEIEQSDFQAKIASLYDTKTKLAVPFLAAAAISCFLWQALPVVYSILFMWMVFSWVFTPMISAPGLLPGTTSFIEAGAQRSGYRRWLALWFDYLKTQVYGMRFFRLYDVAIALMAAGAMVIFGFPVTFALFLLPVSAFGVMGIILAAGSAHFALQAVRPAGSRDGGQEYVLIKLNADMSAQEKALVNNFYQADDRDVVGAQALNNAASRDMRFAGHSLFARLDVRGNESFASIARNVHTVLAQVCAESYPNCCYPAIGLLADLFAGVEGIAVEPRLISVCDENGISRGFHFYAVVQDSNNDRWLFDPTAEQFNGLHEEFASRDGGQVMKVKSLMVGWMRAGNALVKRFVKRVFGAVVGMFSRSYRINGQRFWFVENVRVNPSAVTLIDVARAYAADEFDLAVRGFVGIPESYRERLVAITVKFDTVKPAGRP